MTDSILTKQQYKSFGPRAIDGYAKGAALWAHVRFDDECGNGHNTFSITASVREPGNRDIAAGGCLHDDIAKVYPELAPLIKWHLWSTDGGLHYVANTVYHAEEHGPTHAWVYYTGQSDPLGLGGTRERLLGYETADDARKAEGQPGYRVQWDEKTAKVRNLDYARATAAWPEATDEDLTAPGLKERLEARLPALLAEFRAAMEGLGFTW